LKTLIGKRNSTPSWGGVSAILGIIPLLAFLGYFLLVPIGTIVNRSFHDNKGHFTFSLFTALFSGTYRDAFIGSFKLSGLSMLVSGVLGAFLAAAIVKTNGAIRSLTSSAAGVLANTGGVPLAFMFIAAFGQDGLITKFLLNVFHFDLYGGSFDLFNFWGVLLVYCFFQIPLMVILFTPALENVKGEWREANNSLGGGLIHYIRYILIPNLTPALLSSFVLLFASAFSAFATARAMTIGTVPLVPLVIGNLVNGDVIAGEQNQGDALAVGMVLVAAVVMVVYLLLLRLSQRGLRQVNNES